MIYIRGNHHYHFRSGEWAHLFSIQHDDEGRDLWVVEFPDGAKDVWPAWDTLADYDVRVQIESPVTEDVFHADQVPSPRKSARAAARALLAKVSDD